MGNTINPQGAVKPLSLYVSGVVVRTTALVELTNTDGTPFAADYIEVIATDLTAAGLERSALFTVSVSGAGYISVADGAEPLQSTSGFAGWMGISRSPVTISIPGINITSVSITNRNLDNTTGSYIINYGIKFLEHSMKNRQTDDIGK